MASSQTIPIIISVSPDPLSSVVTFPASSTPTSSSTTTSGGNSGSSSGFFSLQGSPALVLAFLAIGIFAGGLLSLFFLRHIGVIRFLRNRQVHAAATHGDEPTPTTGRRSRRRRILGEKPKLWDYSSRLGMRSRRGWDGIVVSTLTVVSHLPRAHVLQMLLSLYQ
jgi:hypothetical protein